MPVDLANVNRAKATCFPNITDTSADNTIQTLLTVASRAIETWCMRIFSVNSYDELVDSDGSGSVWLRNFPVLSVTRLAMTQVDVMTVICRDNVTNSRAFIMTTQIGQQDIPTPTTGLVLTRVAGGLPVTDATFLWNTYPTVSLLANAVNAVGFAWSAQVQSGYTNWATSDITPMRGAQNALQTTASVQAHTTDLNAYDVIAETGEIRFMGSLSQLFGTGWVPNQYPGSGDLWPGVNLPRGSRNIRVNYTAGFNIIPDAVQHACCLWASHLFQQPNFAGELTGETLADYTYQRVVKQGPPQDVKNLLMPFRDRKI